MKCPSCGKELEKDVDFCYFCGDELPENAEAIDSQDKKSNEKGEIDIQFEEAAEEVNEYENEVSYAVESKVGKAIKVLSVIFIILGVIGSLIIMGESFVTGLAVLLVSVLTGLFAYGIGEIVALLTSINHKI